MYYMQNVKTKEKIYFKGSSLYLIILCYYFIVPISKI